MGSQSQGLILSKCLFITVLWLRPLSRILSSESSLLHHVEVFLPYLSVIIFWYEGGALKSCLDFDLGFEMCILHLNVLKNSNCSVEQTLHGVTTSVRAAYTHSHKSLEAISFIETPGIKTRCSCHACSHHNYNEDLRLYAKFIVQRAECVKPWFNQQQDRSLSNRTNCSVTWHLPTLRYFTTVSPIRSCAWYRGASKLTRADALVPCEAFGSNVGHTDTGFSVYLAHCPWSSAASQSCMCDIIFESLFNESKSSVDRSLALVEISHTWVTASV